MLNMFLLNAFAKIPWKITLDVKDLLAGVELTLTWELLDAMITLFVLQKCLSHSRDTNEHFKICNEPIPCHSKSNITKLRAVKRNN